MLEFPAQELRKYFKMGDHVKVIAGRFEGDTGLIVRVEENFVILFSDLTMHEVAGGRLAVGRLCREETEADQPCDPASFTLVHLPQLKVLPRDLQLCSETASGVDVGGQHEWGELVQLDPQTVGVIVRLERETFQVCVLHAEAGLTLGASPSSCSSWRWQSMWLRTQTALSPVCVASGKCLSLTLSVPQQHTLCEGDSSVCFRVVTESLRPGMHPGIWCWLRGWVLLLPSSSSAWMWEPQSTNT